MANSELLSRRSLIYAGIASLPLAFISAEPAAATSLEEIEKQLDELSESVVPIAEEQAADTFLPVFTRTPTDGPGAAALGFYTGTVVLNGTTDPFIFLGYDGGEGSWKSALGLEADWDTGPGFGQPHVTEVYWQIVKPDGESRRPLFGLYDRTNERAHAWYFMIGNGHSPGDGAPRPVFAVNWDDDSSQVGVGCFTIEPNRLNLHAVTTGGVPADHTRLNMYSAPAKGSAVALSFGGADPESFVGVSFLVHTVSPSYSIMYSQGKQLMKFSNDGSAGAVGFFGAEPITRPVGIGPPATDESSAIALVNNLRSALINLGLVGE